MNWSGAGSDAVAATTVVYSIAPSLRSLFTTWRDGRLLLADGDVDAEDVLALLVDDGVERDGGLAGLAVADDQLALTAPDRDHGVDRLDSGLSGSLTGRRSTTPGARRSMGAELFGLDGPLAVQRLAQGVHDAAHYGVSTGTSAIRPVRLTWSPSLISVSSPIMTLRRCPPPGSGPSPARRWESPRARSP